MTIEKVRDRLNDRVNQAEAANLPSEVNKIIMLAPREVVEDLDLPKPGDPRTADQLLTAKEVAAVLAVKPRWVYHNADSLPFTVRLGPKLVRFSRKGLEKYLDKRRSC